MTALEFSEVSFRYAGSGPLLLDRLSFQVEAGEFVSILGPSGAGKSSLFRLMNGLLLPESGSILAEGVPIAEKKRYCGYMPQQDLLFPWRTVADNVGLPLELGEKPLDRETRRAKAEAVLEAVGLQGWADKSPLSLSGGMRQRAAFARTLLTGAKLLLLDEPFSALDYMTRLSMREWLLERWRQEKRTILFVTHDVEEAIFLSERILVITSRPVRSLREFRVPLSYPRRGEGLGQAAALDLKRELIQLLAREMTA